MNSHEPSTQILSEDDRAALTRLEECLWRAETRFDKAFMDKTMAADFFEYGRSGAVHTREQCLLTPPRPIDAALPLPDLHLRLLAKDLAQLTYNSCLVLDHGVLERARRTSLWSRTNAGWVLRFHQGTPMSAEPVAAVAFRFSVGKP